MAQTGTVTVHVEPGRDTGTVLVPYDVIGHGMCPVCQHDTLALAVVIVHDPAAGDYMWTDCDTCNDDTTS